MPGWFATGASRFCHHGWQSHVLFAALLALGAGCEIDDSEDLDLQVEGLEPGDDTPPGTVAPFQATLDAGLSDNPDCFHPWDNVQAYLDLPGRFPEFTDVLTEQELEDLLRAVETGGVPDIEAGDGPDEMRDLVLKALGTPFLFEGIEQRPMSYAILDEQSVDGGRQQLLVLMDPLLGCFPALLIVPPGPGPHPAVQALHGHSDTPDSWARDYFGERYTDEGYALMIAGTRAFEADQFEDLATRTMLLNGFTMMGVRVAEHLLALKYLRSRPDIDATRIGLIGHSGGSLAGNLTIRVEQSYRGYVSDLRGSYHNIGGEGFLVDETAPSVFSLRYPVNDFSTSRVPVLSVPYQYENGPDEIFDFFDQVLW